MKAWKLQECVAHSPGSVTSVSLGRKSGRVMATGGEDRRVKLWAVGKPTCILSLTGHTSSIEATEFSQEEDRVAAGSLSGSVRIWDLEEVKIVRALSGHTSAVRTLDFHPYGNFVASGSMDTLVKLWDVSRKGCINTYRSHSSGINMIRFSPDGKWIVSAGEDGLVKLWDLSTGKQLAELVGHTGPVVGVAFHPTVLLLATASTDRTVRLFDLENFTQVAVSGTELTASIVRRIAFHPDGVCLYVATSDYLRIYDYETMTCLETVHVGWRAAGGLDDMAVAPSFNQLVGVSISNSLISTYVVDIKSCIPFNNSSSDIDAKNESIHQQILVSSPNISVEPQPVRVTDSVRVTSTEPQQFHERPFTRCGSPSRVLNSRNRKSFCLVAEENCRSVMSEDPSDPEARMPHNPTTEESVELNQADINDPLEYDRVFKPHHTVARSPSRLQSTVMRKPSPPFDSVTSETKHIRKSDGESCCLTNVENPKVTESITSAKSGSLSEPVSSDQPFIPPNIAIKKQLPSSRSVRPVSTSEHSNNIAVEEFLPPPVPDNLVKPLLDNAHTDRTTNSHELSESELLIRIRKSHDPFMKVMTSRIKGLSTVRVMWTQDNIKTALESALLLNDSAILVDVLGILSQNSKLWNLDLVSFLLPRLVELIHSKYSTHVETTCQAVRVIIKNFSQIIRQTLESSTPPGVDLMREERRRKCQECMSHLLSIRSALSSEGVASKAGQFGRELNVMFQLLV